MMTRNNLMERDQLEMLTVDQLVSVDHLVRKLDATIDFSFICPLVEDLYSPFGRPSIDPVVFIKSDIYSICIGDSFHAPNN